MMKHRILDLNRRGFGPQDKAAHCLTIGLQVQL